MHNFGEFIATAMRISRSTIRRWMVLAALAFGVNLCASAQDSTGQSLGDVARKTRKEHAAPDHVPGKQLVNEEEDGPDTTGIWRVRLCSFTPCYELSIALPKSPKWTRAKAEPRPVLIPLPGAEADASRVIRIYAAESLGARYSPVDGAKRVFLQGWFARPEYFGQAARIVLDEHVPIEGANATISHFTVMGDASKYRGLSIVASTPNGSYGFACAFRDEDASAASSICDAIVKSARSQALEPGKRPVYPNYEPPDPPEYYPQRYDPDDPPEDPQ